MLKIVIRSQTPSTSLSTSIKMTDSPGVSGYTKYILTQVERSPWRRKGYFWSQCLFAHVTFGA